MTPKRAPDLARHQHEELLLVALEAVGANYGLRLDDALPAALDGLRPRHQGQSATRCPGGTGERSDCPRTFHATALALVSFSRCAFRGRPRAWFRRSVRSFDMWVRACNEWVLPADAPSFRNMLELEGVAWADGAADSLLQ